MPRMADRSWHSLLTAATVLLIFASFGHGTYEECKASLQNIVLYEGATNTLLSCWNGPNGTSWVVRPTSNSSRPYQITSYNDTVPSTLSGFYALNQTGVVVRNATTYATGYDISTAGIYIVNFNASDITQRTAFKIVVIQSGPDCKCVQSTSSAVNISCTMVYADHPSYAINATLNCTGNGQVYDKATLNRTLLNPVPVGQQYVYNSTSTIVVENTNPSTYDCVVAFAKPYFGVSYLATNAPNFSVNKQVVCGTTTTTLTTTTQLTTTTKSPTTTSKPLSTTATTAGQTTTQPTTTKTTSSVTTPGPTTSRPATTPGPTTPGPTTPGPTTPGPTTPGPTTPGPTTSQPATTPGPTTSQPATTPGPTTPGPTTPAPTTPGPTTPGPTISQPATTPGPTISQPATTPGPTISQPATTPGPTISQPATTPGPTNSQPATTPGPTNSQADTTPGPTTPGPATPGPTTQGPITPGPITPGPTTPGPAISQPATTVTIPSASAPGPTTGVSQPAFPVSTSEATLLSASTQSTTTVAIPSVATTAPVDATTQSTTTTTTPSAINATSVSPISEVTTSVGPTTPSTAPLSSTPPLVLNPTTSPPTFTIPLATAGQPTSSTTVNIGLLSTKIVLGTVLGVLMAATALLGCCWGFLYCCPLFSAVAPARLPTQYIVDEVQWLPRRDWIPVPREMHYRVIPFYKQSFCKCPTPLEYRLPKRGGCVADFQRPARMAPPPPRLTYVYEDTCA